jgi:hypothetical protein
MLPASALGWLIYAEDIYENTTVNPTIRGTPFYAYSVENKNCNVRQLSSISFTLGQPIIINSRLQEMAIANLQTLT